LNIATALGADVSDSMHPLQPAGTIAPRLQFLDRFANARPKLSNPKDFHAHRYG
jgi:hypothetical protein